jgi:RNA polymerase sigma-70 factor, ECF subfamily
MTGAIPAGGKFWLRNKSGEPFPAGGIKCTHSAYIGKHMALRSEIAGEVPHLRRFALALTGNASLADDLVQDCIEQALRKQHLFDETRKLRSWLFAILRNLYISGLRRNSRGTAASLEFDVASAMGKMQEQEAQLVLSDVKAAITRLPPLYREVLLLIALEGMSYREVSEVTGVPVGTVMSRVARARAGLRTLLGENGTSGLRRVK